jgi:hypothetical protein
MATRTLTTSWERWPIAIAAASLSAPTESTSDAMDQHHEQWTRRAIPVSRLTTIATRQHFQSAWLVLGYDEATEKLVLRYGREVLDDPLRSAELERHSLVLRYNSRIDALDDLLAVCQELKCRCDYDPQASEPWPSLAKGDPSSTDQPPSEQVRVDAPTRRGEPRKRGPSGGRRTRPKGP